MDLKYKLIEKYYLAELNNHYHLMNYYLHEIDKCKHKIYKINKRHPFILNGAQNEKLQIKIIQFLDHHYFIEKKLMNQKYKMQIGEALEIIEMNQRIIRIKLTILEGIYFLVKHELKSFSRALVVT